MAHLTNLSFEFFYKIFTEDASRRLLYNGAKKSKTTKNSNQGSALKIRPVLGLNTRESRAQYTAVYENYMEKSVTAQDKAHFSFFCACQETSLLSAIKREGAFDQPRPSDGEYERFQPGFIFPLAWDETFLPLRKRTVSAGSFDG